MRFAAFVFMLSVCRLVVCSVQFIKGILIMGQIGLQSQVARATHISRPIMINKQNKLSLNCFYSKLLSLSVKIIFFCCTRQSTYYSLEVCTQKSSRMHKNIHFKTPIFKKMGSDIVPFSYRFPVQMGTPFLCTILFSW